MFDLINVQTIYKELIILLLSSPYNGVLFKSSFMYI